MPRKRGEPGRELDDLLQLGATWAAVTRVLERSLQGADISLPQALAVLAIAWAPQPLLLSQLATRLLQQPQSMTTLMDRLEQAGWAQRVSGLPDRRAIRAELTEDGAAKADEVGARLLAAAAQVLASLDEPKRAGLAESLAAIYAACRTQPGMRLPELPDGDTRQAC
jgi:DNA-binding MarR family transcriptional regulator